MNSKASVVGVALLASMPIFLAGILCGAALHEHWTADYYVQTVNPQARAAYEAKLTERDTACQVTVAKVNAEFQSRVAQAEALSQERAERAEALVIGTRMQLATERGTVRALRAATVGFEPQK